MADVQHSGLLDPQIHEPKDVAAAASGDVYVADGASSGAWGKYDYTDLINQELILNVKIIDINTAGSVWVVSPVAGTITKIYSVIDGVFTVADTIVTGKINAVNITNGAITIANSGSAAGVVDSATPTANNAVSIGDAIELSTDGGGTGATAGVFTILLKQ